MSRKVGIKRSRKNRRSGKSRNSRMSRKVGIKRSRKSRKVGIKRSRKSRRSGKKRRCDRNDRGFVIRRRQTQSKRRHLRFRAGSSGEHPRSPHVLDPPDDCSMCLEVMQPPQKLFVWGCNRHRTHDACTQNYRIVQNRSPLPCPSCRAPTHVDCVPLPSIPLNTFEWLHAYINNLDANVERINLLDYMPNEQLLTALEIDTLAEAILSKPNLLDFGIRRISLEDGLIELGGLGIETTWVGNQNLIRLTDIVQLWYLLRLEPLISRRFIVSVYDYPDLAHNVLERMLAKHELSINTIKLDRIQRTLKMPKVVKKNAFDGQSDAR